jgi:hypothetical protein
VHESLPVTTRIDGIAAARTIAAPFESEQPFQSKRTAQQGPSSTNIPSAINKAHTHTGSAIPEWNVSVSPALQALGNTRSSADRTAHQVNTLLPTSSADRTAHQVNTLLPTLESGCSTSSSVLLDPGIFTAGTANWNTQVDDLLRKSVLRSSSLHFNS